MIARTFRVYRDAYVIGEIQVDEHGRVVGEPEVYVQTYDSRDIVEALSDGHEVEAASFPAGVDWPEGMPHALGADVALPLAI